MNDADHEFYCQDLDDILTGCDEDKPSPEALARLERHIETCDTCRNAERAISATVDVFRSTDPGGVTAAFEQTLLGRLCGGRSDTSPAE